MASEIHRRRTGRGLKVTEEIVLREEMYEEDEDDLPRQFKYLTSHLQTNSPDMNSRLNAYITTQAAMATMARYNEVNRLFSESFPSAQAYQQQLNQSMYSAPFMKNLSNGATTSPSQSHTQPSSISPTQDQKRPSMDDTDRRPSAVESVISTTSTSISSPSALSPSSSTTPESRNTPYQTPVSAFPSSFHMDPQLAQRSSSSGSIFTSELPNEVKQMANIDMSDPMAMSFFGGDNGFNPSDWSMFGQLPGEDLKSTENSACDQGYDGSETLPQVENNDDAPASLFPHMDSLSHGFDLPPVDGFSRVGTPGGGGGGDTWDSFVDFGSEH